MWVENLENRRMLAGEKILFIRGGTGTGGFIDGGSLAKRDGQLADITNNSTATKNHGWGELAKLLKADGFSLTQVIEQPNQPINLAGMNLSQYKGIVFGSNNADYTPNGSSSHVNAVENFVKNGGGVMFISDGNFGTNYGDAPSSDQDFMNRFGLVMNQDRGTYAVSRNAGDFRAGGHPLLASVNQFDGEGVSPIVKKTTISSVTTQILVRAKGGTRNNDSFGKGSDRNATANDAALIVSSTGKGRVIGHFDRNTFFNLNGAGTSLHRFDNTQLAKNLFRFLAGRFTSKPQAIVSEFRTDTNPPQTVRVVFSEDVGASANTKDLSLRNLSTGATYTPAGVYWDSTNRYARWRFGSTLPAGNYRATIAASAIQDGSGNKMAANHTFDFPVGSSAMALPPGIPAAGLSPTGPMQTSFSKAFSSRLVDGFTDEQSEGDTFIRSLTAL